MVNAGAIVISSLIKVKSENLSALMKTHTHKICMQNIISLIVINHRIRNKTISGGGISWTKIDSVF